MSPSGGTEGGIPKVPLDVATLEARIAKLSAEEKRLRDLIIMVGHELRNPLSTIRAHMEMVREDPEAGARAAEVVLTKVEQLDRIIGDLLFITRLESGQLHLKPTSMDLVDLVQSVAHQAQTLDTEHHLRVACDQKSAPGCWDAHRLSQVLQNLLSNATKYSPPGSEIVIEVDRQEKEVGISVADQGIGVSPQALPRLFDPFFRAEGAGGSIRGFGVGLYVSRLLVEAHGGRIWVESAGENQGTTAKLVLPIRDC